MPLVRVVVASIGLLAERILAAPASRIIEILQRQAERIDLAMTGHASLVRAMGLEAGTQCGGGLLAFVDWTDPCSRRAAVA